MKEELQQIGLTEREADIYLTLLKMGKTRIGPLSSAMGLHKQILYNAFENLKTLELVKETKINNRRNFEAADPDVLIQKNREKASLLNRIVPELQLMQGAMQHTADIKVYAGVDAFHKFIKRMISRMPENGNVDVLGAGGEDLLKIMRVKYFFDRYENTRLRKKISHRLLMYENQRNTDTAYTKRKYIETKYMSQKLETQPVATVVWPDSVSILLFGEDPQIIHIKSKKIRDGFGAYFESLWQSANK